MQRTGYVWGGLLTNASIKFPNGKQAVWGLIESKYKDNFASNVKASVRLIDNGKLISKHDFPVENAGRPDEGYLYLYAKPLLKNVNNILIFGTPSEACGVTATNHYFMVMSDKVVFVGSGYSVGDGGAMFSSLEYVFPYESMDYENYYYTPKAEHVLKVENNGSYDDDCVWEETKKAKDFLWDGSALSKSCEY